MKQHRTHTVWRLLSVCLVSVTLAGCGMEIGTMAGVGSGGTGGAGGATVVASAYKASLAATPAGGHLINAVVFLDINSNYQLDSDEPYAATGVDGTATLEAAPAVLASSPVVAVAFKGITVDSDTMQPVLSTYVLSAPKASVAVNGSTAISPISTQVRELLETGRYATAQQAMNTLGGRLGLPPDVNLLAENIAVGNPALNAAAKSIAALMWIQAPKILAPGETTPAVDVQRYRAMMKLIEENMNIVSTLNTQENLLNLNSNITAVLEVMPKKAVEPPRTEENQGDKP